MKPSSAAVSELDLLKQFIYSIQPLNNAEWKEFSKIWQPFQCNRKTLLRASGAVERNLYFVIEGVQRAYYVGNNQKEATLVFTYPPSFSGVADSFLTQQPSHFHFETLTKSFMLRTDFEEVNRLMNQYHSIESLIRKATAFALKGVIERMTELMCFNAEEKFLALLRRSPHLLNLVPHKYLASYLGIDATTFSKLLGKTRL